MLADFGRAAVVGHAMPLQIKVDEQSGSFLLLIVDWLSGSRKRSLMLRRFIRSGMGRALSPSLNQLASHSKGASQDVAGNENWAATPISLLPRSCGSTGAAPRLRDTGFRVFSQFEEDGKLLFIFAAMGLSSGTFVDIGAADGINSNCANLALNFGWHGVFIDGNRENIRRGEKFYSEHPDTRLYPSKFVHAMVTRENVMISKNGQCPCGCGPNVDRHRWQRLLGRDAIDAITPKVVIIETHIEFGSRSIVVPYDKTYVYPGKHPDYHGASPTAMKNWPQEGISFGGLE